MNIRMIGAAALLLATVTACGGSTDTSSTPGKYDQSWPKTYDATSCSEWLDQMSPHQRFAAAADMLTGARNKGDSGTGLPPDDLIDDFSSDVDSVCEAGAGPNLAESAVLVYLQKRSHYRP